MNAPVRKLSESEYAAFVEEHEAETRAMSTQQYDRYCDAQRFPHFVYRYWCDTFPEGKQLLYVGFTGDFGSRDAIHQVNSWWRGLVTRYDMDLYFGRAEARAAEARTIKAEVPLFNIHKNPRHAEVHGPDWTGPAVEARVFKAIREQAMRNPIFDLIENRAS